MSQPSRGGPAPRELRAGWIVAFGLSLMLVTWLTMTGGTQPGAAVDYSTFLRALDEDRVERVTLKGQEISARLRKPEKIGAHQVSRIETMGPPGGDPALLVALKQRQVEIEAVEDGGGTRGLWGPLTMALLGFAFWWWLSRNAAKMLGSGPSAAGPLAGARAKRFDEKETTRVRFCDVAGLPAAKRDLEEVVLALQKPEHFGRLGGKMPRGVLLVGPPGTGKTLLARAVAGEARVPFFVASGSEFIELFVGVGAARVRELFAAARAAAPAIVFIDEIDAVGRVRGAGLGGGHDEREQTLNQLLAEMDGFSRDEQVVVLAATNRPDVLDPALLRPGRFDRRVLVERPELAARCAILAVHAKGKPLAPDVALDHWAAETPGFSGADLANLLNEAAIAAMRRGAERIEQADLAAAFDKIVLGDLREIVMPEAERRRVALHEAGHALVAELVPFAERVQHVSILPRGTSLGATRQRSGGERHLATENELSARLQVLMGGYAAEVLVLGEPSSGAENDLREASRLALQMVSRFGMSARVGPVFHELHEEHPFLGNQLATASGVSDATTHTIEEEVRRLLTKALEQASSVLSSHRSALEQLSAHLLRKESLEGDDVRRIAATSPVALAAQ